MSKKPYTLPSNNTLPRRRLLSITTFFLITFSSLTLVEARAPHQLHPDPIPPFLPLHYHQVGFKAEEDTKMTHDYPPPPVSTPHPSHPSPYEVITTVPRTRHNSHYNPSHYPLPPSSPLSKLTLEQVHIYVRHGERTPVSIRLDKGPEPVEKRWRMCFGRGKLPPDAGEGGGEPTVKINGDTKKGKVNGKVNGNGEEEGEAILTSGLGLGVQIEGRDGSILDGECLLGELTDVGRQSTYNFGLYLRQIYISTLHFLPSTFLHESDKSQVYFRSTFLPRTIESLQHVIRGLYPPSTCPASSSTVALPTSATSHEEPGFFPILTRNTRDETLFPNSHICKSLEQKLISHATAVALEYNPILSQYDHILGPHISGMNDENGEPPSGKIRIDGKPRASGIMDTVRAALASDVKVPEVFRDEDSEVMRVVDGAVVEEWFGGYRDNEQCKLGIGPLLNEMVGKMEKVTSVGHSSGEKEPKLLVHSTHDTSIAAVLQGLGVFDDWWPPFTTSLTFELYSRSTEGDDSANDASDYYIRLLYQTTPLLLPFCSSEDQHLPGHPEFCKFDVFREKVREWDMSPEEWEEACRGSSVALKAAY